MNSNRRVFLSSAAGGAAVLSGVGVFARRLEAQASGPIGGPVPKFPGPPLQPVSGALVSAVATTAKTVTRQFYTHKVSSTDVRKFGTTIALLYSNLDETGASAQMESSMRTAGVLDSPLTYEQLRAARAKSDVSPSGLAMTDAQFEVLYQSYSVTFPAFQKLVAQGGVAAVRAKVLQGFEGLAFKIDRDGQLSRSFSGPHLRTVQDSLEVPPDYQGSPIQQVCAYLNIAGVYFSTWGYMAWAGAAAFTPVGDAALAIVALGAAVVAFVYC